MTSKDILIIIFIIILAGIVRWTSIDKAGYWCDEIYTLVGSTGHMFDETVDGEMLDPYFAVSPTYYKKWIDPYRGDFKSNFMNYLKSYEAMPPAYFFFEHFIIKWFGTSEPSTRFLSFFFNLLSIPLVWLLTCALSSRRAATIATILFAFNPFQVMYSQTARPYTMLIFLVLLSSYAISRILFFNKLNNTNRFWILYILSSIVGLYTSYSYMFILLFHISAGALVKWHDSEFRRYLFLSTLIIGIAFIPWISILIHQNEYWSIKGHFTDGILSPFHFLKGLIIALTSLFDNQYIWKLSSINKVVITTILFGLSTYGFLKLKSFKLKLFSFSWIIFTIGMVVLLDLIRSSHASGEVRYFSSTAPIAYILLSVGLVNAIKRPLGILLSIVTVGYLVLASYNTIAHKYPLMDQHKEAATYISSSYESRDLILCNSAGPQSIATALYLDDTCEMGGLGIELKLGAPLTSVQQIALINKLDKLTKDRKRLWVIFSHTNEARGELLIKKSLSDKFRIAKTKQFSGVEVLLFISV